MQQQQQQQQAQAVSPAAPGLCATASLLSGPTAAVLTLVGSSATSVARVCRPGGGAADWDVFGSDSDSDSGDGDGDGGGSGTAAPVKGTVDSLLLAAVAEFDAAVAALRATHHQLAAEHARAAASSAWSRLNGGGAGWDDPVRPPRRAPRRVPPALRQTDSRRHGPSGVA